MEYWKEEKTPAFAEATAWQGRQNEKHWNSGRLEGWGKRNPSRPPYLNLLAFAWMPSALALSLSKETRMRG